MGENPLAVPPSTVAAAVPEFWLTTLTLSNHVGLSVMIADRDAGALKYLTDLREEATEAGEIGEEELDKLED
jgi:hypothetical protein